MILLADVCIAGALKCTTESIVAPGERERQVYLRSQGDGNSILEMRLRDSLEMEREAVLDFMYSVVDLVRIPTTFYPSFLLKIESRGNHDFLWDLMH